MINWQSHQLWRVVALAGYFATLFFLMAWIIVLSPPQQLAKSVVLSIALLPLLLPLRGLLHGRPYTHAWASFLALAYFAFGVDAAVHQKSDNWLGVTLVFCSLLWFSGCVFYAKFKKRQAVAG